jgi:hypothetical protein
VTTREQAERLKVLRERHPEKCERDLMESLATIKEGDEAIKLIRTRFEGIPSAAERQGEANAPPRSP